MRVVISAAGTGGHINPAISIANKIRKEEPNSEIVFVGTNRGLENDLVPRAGYQLKTIEAYGVQKEISIRNLKNIIKTFLSKKDVKNFFDEFKPDLVIGTGGYICVPVFSVAVKEKIPTVLHESNAFPGRAVKMFYNKVDRVFVGFKETKEYLGNKNNIIVSGTPTKVNKINLILSDKKKILSDIGLKADLPVVLVFGGSQGAQKINEAIFDLINQEKNKNYQIIWGTGPKQFDIIKDKFKEKNKDIDDLKNVKILPYIYNMDELMNVSDLLICRSGALTITEICKVGKPAIFIPLPSKMANRQEDNARVLEKIGAAKIILNDEINFQNLSNNIDNIIYDRLKLIEMGDIANKLSNNNVEEIIYNEIKKIVK